ncbi:hypothetical protein GZ77_02785 [Endozoicomonas montiporae]|uniref:HTH tetR-type domain-containing protein n=2 Tax=Endozoicomonas montiporae TaxID=1027273 RepID=A0A081NAT4_9GAMM|nr:TetR/AcrR family transcriptional regulator [Endozoicomonas montiporae]AMO56748.1 transcriptional regulator [Endozoicomonas montiporae CL-33]KEQ15557.1 hypothetical protein GZ77_02785 [Endozoicomonas montiporae]
MSYPVLSRRERKKQFVDDSILKGAVILIEQQGVLAVTVETICTQADISRMTFYKYYRSRHDLLIRLCFDRLLSPLADSIQIKVRDDSRSLSQQLHDFYQPLLQWFLQSGRLHRELIIYLVSSFQMDDHDRPELQSFLTSQLVSFYRHYAGQLKTGLTPEFCAATTTGAVAGLTFCWLNEPEYPVQQRLQQVLKYLVTSFTVSSTA